MKRIENTFKEKLYECKKHYQKILDAKEFLSEIMPLNVDKYSKINKIESSFIDQLIYRFSKLQDTMGESIFKGILILSKEEVKSKTFLDILNRLEELEVVDKERWLKLREYRNEIVHEYSFNQEEIVDSINKIYEVSDELLQIYDKVYQFVNKKFNIK